MAVVSARRGRGPRGACEPRLHLAAGRGVRGGARPGGAAGDAAQQAARDELVVRFQQTTGPVLAKGVEDTAFYRWPGWSR